MKMTCDADCARAGWVEVMAWGPMGQEFHFSCPPDADWDEDLCVFDHDDQRMRTIHAWLWTFEPVGVAQ